ACVPRLTIDTLSVPPLQLKVPGAATSTHLFPAMMPFAMESEPLTSSSAERVMVDVYAEAIVTLAKYVFGNRPTLSVEFVLAPVTPPTVRPGSNVRLSSAWAPFATPWPVLLSTQFVLVLHVPPAGPTQSRLASRQRFSSNSNSSLVTGKRGFLGSFLLAPT